MKKIQAGLKQVVDNLRKMASGGYEAQYSIHRKHLNKIQRIADKLGVDLVEDEQIDEDESMYRVVGDQKAVAKFLKGAFPGESATAIDRMISKVK